MDRRKFLTKGTAVSAAIVTSTTVLGSIGGNLISKKTINLGIIGTGSRGCGLIPFIKKIEGLNVYACCDVLPFRLQDGLDRTDGKAKGYVDYKDLLSDKAIDAVLIATPFSTHFQVATDAINSGKHVYCEKTLAKGYNDTLNLVVQVKEANTIFQAGHQFNSSRLYMHIIKLLKDGKVGRITAFESQWNRFTDWRQPVPDPSLEKLVNWRMYKEFSGGLVSELCSHQIDFVNTVIGENPEQVMGTGGIDYWKDGRETYDNIHLMYNYPNGVKAKFTCLTSNAKDGYQIKVIGDKGTLIIGARTAKFYPAGGKKKKPVVREDVDGVSGATWQADDKWYGESINVAHDDPSKWALIDFRDCIIDDKEPASNVLAAARTAICVQMGLDAMHSNKVIYWNPEHDLY